MNARILFPLLAIILTGSTQAADPSKGEKLFALQLQRLFAEKCLGCHGADSDEIAGAFDMRTRESMLLGGESFGTDVLKPNHGTDSILYVVTTRREAGFEMPPKESEKLSLEEQNWLRDWINEGAPWPDADRVREIRGRYATGEVVETSGGLSEEWNNRRYEKKLLWAYRPLRVVQPEEGVHPVDWFINRRLEELELSPAPDATPLQLARRLSYGLTGLPPEYEDGQSRATKFAEQFATDSDVAIDCYIEELMASPHYGEHFGGHWLDVVRYADTGGFANDYPRPNAWRYRDYVIRAFNEDKPYDEFVRQQIAGDELDPGDAENLIAAGFLRMGPWEQTAMSVFRVTRQQWLDDVVDSVGQSFLGHALQCAKCHDHKFDPVPTRDYYSMMAVFSTTQFAEPDVPFLSVENQDGFAESTQWTKAKLSGYSRQIRELKARIATRRRKEDGEAKVGDTGLDPGDENSLARMNKNSRIHTWELDQTRPVAFSVYTGKTVPRKSVNGRLRQPDSPWAAGHVEDDTILTGGDAYTRGDPVRPGPLSAAVQLGDMDESEFPTGQGQRRLALANWIVANDNPLTPRVIVNRVWSWHFGKGLAGNPNNLGATGELPTHPELLDFLADWFVSHGWSIRRLNRLILTSNTFRRGSHHPSPSELSEKDPLSRSYAVFQPRRLTAEEIRDSMLAVSGELNRKVGGVPCRPDINSEVAFQPRQIMGGTASVYEPDPLPQQRNRRSIYARRMRGLRDPFLETFNQPGPDKSCELRETSTVAPQALTLFNAAEVQDRALTFAASLIGSGGTREEVIRTAFLRAFARPATQKEIAACLAHWDKAIPEQLEKRCEEPQFASQVERTVMAEKTGEPYTFTEFLPAFETYVPDLQPCNTDAETRALAHVCLVLFNLNEFSYLD